MKLSDVMGAMGLHSFAEAGLLLAIGAFLAVVVWTFLRRNAERYERARFLPLADDAGDGRGGPGAGRRGPGTRERA